MVAVWLSEGRRRRSTPAAVAAAALFLAGYLWWYNGDLGRWALRTAAQQYRVSLGSRRSLPPPAFSGACAELVPVKRAAAEAAAVAAGAPPLKEVETRVEAEQCSDAFREKAAANGTTEPLKGGAGPRLMAWGCPIEQVDAACKCGLLFYRHPAHRFPRSLPFSPCTVPRGTNTVS